MDHWLRRRLQLNVRRSILELREKEVRVAAEQPCNISRSDTGELIPVSRMPVDVGADVVGCGIRYHLIRCPKHDLIQPAAPVEHSTKPLLMGVNRTQFVDRHLRRAVEPDRYDRRPHAPGRVSDEIVIFPGARPH